MARSFMAVKQGFRRDIGSRGGRVVCVLTSGDLAGKEATHLVAYDFHRETNSASRFAVLVDFILASHGLCAFNGRSRKVMKPS